MARGSIRFVVPGDPRGKAVARVTRFGTHIPTATREEMDTVKRCADQAMDAAGLSPFAYAVELSLACYMPIPKSWSKTKQAEALAGKIRHTSKPDGSNLQKLVEDAIIGIVIIDDSQVAAWRGWKIYSAEPRYVVEVKELEATP